jgi:GTP cyclohydrolase I
MTDFTRWFNNIIEDAHAQEWAEKSEERHSRAYQEMLRGYNLDPEKLLFSVEPNLGHGLVGQKNIPYTSVCQHHLLPFLGKIDIVYEPGNGLFGAGKLPRVVEAHACRLQLQENICRDVANTLCASGAQGTYVRATATHTCMTCRGPKTPDVLMTSQYYKGSLSEERLDAILLALKE